MRHWVVEIPHQLRVGIWDGTRDDIVQAAQRLADRRGTGGWWQGWYSLEQAVDEYGEVPEGWRSVLERTNEVTEIGGQLYATGEEPQTEFEWAIATLGEDLHAIYVFDDVDKMAAWAQSYSGHQSLVVQALVTQLVREVRAQA